MSGKVLAITKRKSFAVVCGLVLLALAASCSPAPASLPVPTMTVVGDDLHPTAVSTAARASVFQQGVEVAQVPSLTPTASPTATLPPLLLATNTQAADSPVIQARVQAPVAVAQADAATLTPSPTSAGVLPAQPPPEQAVAPHQAVIHFDRHASDAQRKAYLDQIGATVRQNIDQLDAVVVDIPADVRVQALPTSDAVQASEPDYIASALVDSAPSDTYFADQWGLTAINAQQAWLDLPANPTLVKVAVIDSGVCLTHPDLAGHVLAGWDYVEQDATPQDGYGHGCGVAGIIAANIDNGIGIAGIAPNARILPLRVLDANGSGTYSNVAQAMVDATDQGAQVINLSLGGASPSSVLESAVAYALARGVTVVAAAGNNGANGALYPAKYSGVIAVGSMDQTLQPSSFSNYGTDIGLWAPGSGILSLRNGGGYGPMSGTSFAAPEVSGIAALDIALGVSLRANGGQAVAGQSSPPEATVDVTPTVTPTATATVTETSGTPTATVDPSTLVMVPGFEVSADIQTQTRIALAASLDRLPAARYYTISGLQQYDRWYFVSAVGLAKLDPDIGWKLDDATWTGLVLLEQHGETWSGAVEGSVAFSDLLAQIPDDLVSAAAKQDLDPRSRVILPLSAYRFPWDSGTSMLYGVEGLHDNGFAGVVSGWKAVDMLSDGNTASGHAPNRLRASAAGTIGYVCTPHSGETTTALKIGNVMYTHLQFSSGSFSTGRVVSQGEVLGQMRTGSFSENCGYASQGSSWFHVHWGFPNTGSFGAESWTLNFTDQLWHNGSQTRAAGSGWIQALWGASAPTPTKTPTPTPTPTRTPTPVPSLPANSNLIANGDFASGETSWKFSNISHSVKSGVLNTYRKSSSAGTAYQDIGYAATSGAGFELNLLLGNSSTKAKPVTISIRDSSGTTGQIQCTVTVPASSGLIAYRVRGLAGAAWAKIRVQLAPTTNDNTAALLVDNVNLQYKPSGLGAASCGAVLSADTPLLINGDFSKDRNNWSFGSGLSSGVSSGVLRVYRKSSSAGNFSQDLPYSSTSGSGFEVGLQLGNSSSKAKTVTVTLRDQASATGQIQCVFSVPAYRALTSYRVRGLSDANWSTLRLDMALTEADKASYLLVDNVTLQYKTSGLSGLDCATTLPSDTQLLANGDFSKGTDTWRFGSGLSSKVSSGVLNVYHKNSNAGNFSEDLSYRVAGGSAFELNMQLGNSSSKAKAVVITLRDPASATGQVQCSFNVPAKTAVKAYQVRGIAGATWNDLRLDVSLTVADNAGYLLVDNVNLQYKAAPSFGTTECNTPAGATSLGVSENSVPVAPTTAPTATLKPVVPTDHPTATLPVTETQAAPTEEPTATGVEVSPTATEFVPTETPVPPTDTPAPTETPIPPTNTVEPPTDVPPPTDTPTDPPANTGDAAQATAESG